LPRDLPCGAPRIFTYPCQSRLRHVHTRATQHPAVVRDASCGESSVGFSHATVWLRTLLYEGNRAALGDDGAYLPRHRTLRDTSGDRCDSLHGLSGDYLLFTAEMGSSRLRARG